MLDCEAFDGDWILSDCARPLTTEIVIVCLARLLVVRVVADAVRRQMRSEDLCEDVSATRAYLADLAMNDAESGALDRLLAALTPFDPERITEELLAGCARAHAAGLDGSARCFAELAYETAALHRLDAGAQGAALAIARLATLDEAPRSARKWQARGYVHGRREARSRFSPAVDA
ncbi:MAG: hypothetical protein ACT443_13895 [Gemmatimonadota bacterium]